jgi:hypothetical protein
MGETIAPFPEACLARVQSGCHPPLINRSSASLAATVLLWAKPSLVPPSPPSFSFSVATHPVGEEGGRGKEHRGRESRNLLSP